MAGFGWGGKTESERVSGGNIKKTFEKRKSGRMNIVLRWTTGKEEVPWEIFSPSFRFLWFAYYGVKS